MLRIVFMGTPNFSVPILEALIENYEVVGVVTQPDKLVGRKRELVKTPVKKVAEKYGIPVFQPIKIREDYQGIIDLNPDLIVTAAYGQIVGTKLLFSPKYKSINVHGSLLPKHRGGAPIQRAIMNGDKTTGITIMYMAKGMDSGDMLAQKEIEILDTDTSSTLFERLSLVGRDLLLEVIPKLINNEIVPIKQDESLVTYSYNILPEEERIDFSKDATSIYNQIRSLLDEPCAYFNFKGFDSDTDRIKVVEAKIGSITTFKEPGSIVGKSKKYFTIACGNGTTLDIYKLQPFGKNKMSATDFINGGLRKYWKEN